MQRPHGRKYRRYKRKVACSYCNSRHIRCRTPEPSPEDESGRLDTKACQACKAANERCDRERSPSATATRLQQVPVIGPAPSRKQQHSRGVRLSTKSSSSQESQQQQQQQNLGWQSKACDAPGSLDDINSLPYTSPSGVDEVREGSEMLLVRLVDTSEHQDQEGYRQSANKTIYFGNDSIFSYTIRNAGAGSPAKTHNSQTPIVRNPAAKEHFTIPETLDQWPHDIPMESSDDRFEEFNSLRRKGAFELPPLEVQEALLETYFSVVYPSQRILDKKQFYDDYNSGCASKFLLQMLFFIATIFCDEKVITANWKSRRAAQILFFARAKALYDADHEQNRVTIVQGLFLMSFWWRSPTDQKDFTHWLGAAIRFAQANGMHRSTKHSGMPIRERRLWKRIWWALFVRDHFDSASVGRPMQIHDEDSDIEPLEIMDFDEDGDTSGDRTGALQAIEMARLAVIMGRIIRPVSRNRVNSSSEQLEELDEWEASLHPDLKYEEGQPNKQTKTLSGVLCLAFHFCKMRVNRQILLESNPAHEACQHALISANTIVRVVEDLIAEELLRHVHVHVIASLFSCLTLFATLFHQSKDARRRIFRHKIELCLMALGEFSLQWPFVGWMYRLFRKLLEHLTVEDSRFEAVPVTNKVTSSAEMTTHPVTFNSSADGVIRNSGENMTALANSGIPSASEMWISSCSEAQPVSGMSTFENFVDPLAFLGSGDWMNQPIDLETTSWAWPLSLISRTDQAFPTM